MKPILNLANTNNWEPFWNTSRVAQPVPDKPDYYTQIDPIVAPFLLENHTIAIVPTSSSAKPWIKWAGSVAQKVQTGILVGGSADAASVARRSIWLNQVNLIRFTALSPNYALEIYPSYRLKDISVQLFVYTGIDSDTVTESLDRIENALNI